ncbi:MAG: C69 family dipeptidase [Candidatus Aminicenantes bacterium]|nr:C69 family dipeptidase [Candidatus Aminicenantes bacterium]
MNHKKWISLSAILIICFFFTGGFILKQSSRPETALFPEYPEGCTSILVGKAASTDGSTMTTHTCDCGICDWTWRHVPAADHKEGSVRKIYHINQYRTWPPAEGLKWERYKDDYTELDMPQVPHTFAYHHGMFGYMNEKQVAIGESTIGCQRKMRNQTPAAKFDITMLTLMAMERAETARQAIKIMGEFGEKYGYGYNDGGEMLAVADPDEVWIFEIMPVGPLWTPESGKPGAVWCAQRVPDDHVSVCPNESRIGEIDRNNPDFFMFSPNVISCAVEMGFYDPESGEPFSWKKAYSPSEGSTTSTHGRRGRLWRFLSLVAPSQNFSPDTPNMEFPFSVKPDKKLSVQDVFSLTRDKYRGNMYDPSQGIKAGPFANPNYFRGFELDKQRYTGPRCICVSNVEYTTVTQCRGGLPDPIGGIIWLSFGAQDTACYMPLYAGITALPESFQIGDHWIFERDSARWASDYVDFHTQVIYSYAIEDVKKAQEKWEGIASSQIPVVDRTALALYEKNPEEAFQYLTDFCINHAVNVVNAWWKLGDMLLVKYNHFRIYDPETRKAGRITLPESWLRSIVEVDKLAPLPPRDR